MACRVQWKQNIASEWLPQTLQVILIFYAVVAVFYKTSAISYSFLWDRTNLMIRKICAFLDVSLILCALIKEARDVDDDRKISTKHSIKQVYKDEKEQQTCEWWCVTRRSRRGSGAVNWRGAAGFNAVVYEEIKGR